MIKQEVMQKLVVGILTALISAYIWKRING
ncbi:hypothetical protein XM71_c12640 [Vibrio parahaemolyticus]|nr:hypothetical protein XM71_c12640 [Vibrio parahaemolyticus]